MAQADDVGLGEEAGEVELGREVLVAVGLDRVLAEGDGTGVVAEQDGWRKGEVFRGQEFGEDATDVHDLAAAFEEGDILGLAGGCGRCLLQSAAPGEWG